MVAVVYGYPRILLLIQLVLELEFHVGPALVYLQKLENINGFNLSKKKTTNHTELEHVAWVGAIVCESTRARNGQVSSR